MSDEPTANNDNPRSRLIFQLIPEVMAKLGAIEKAQQNKEQGYRFRGIDDVHNALQRLLAEAGLFYVPDVIERETQIRERLGGKVSYHTFVRVRFTFWAKDGSSVFAVTAGEGLDHGSDKSTNKAMSAAEKYALLQTFCVPTIEQDDSDRSSPNVNDAEGAPQARTASPATKTNPKSQRGPARPAKDATATQEQLDALTKLLGRVAPPEGEDAEWNEMLDGWFIKASEAARKPIEAYEDMKADTIVAITKKLEAIDKAGGWKKWLEASTKKKTPARGKAA